MSDQTPTTPNEPDTLDSVGGDIEIGSNIQGIMADLETGDAFDKTILNDLSALDDDLEGWLGEQSSLFGTFSPSFGGLEGLLDTRPMTMDDLGSFPNLDTDGVQAMLGKPLGVLSNLKAHVGGQFESLADNLSLYATGQSVNNALGNSQGCGGLTDAFGSVMSFGKDIAATVKTVKGAIGTVKALKTQIQSEIDSFDDNVIGLLTGRINGTIMADIVKGSGLHDQIDGILGKAGISGADAQEIRNEVGKFLTPNVRDFFNKKSEMNSAVGELSSAKGGIMGQISKELGTVNKVTKTLRTLGAASSLQGLFKTNACAQTLLGHVASSGLISKLNL